MVSNASICQLTTSISWHLVTMSHRLFLFGTGPMKRKRDQSFPFNSNTLRSSRINIGSSLIPTTHKSSPLTVSREFFSSTGRKAFLNSNTTPLKLKRRTSQMVRVPKLNSLRPFSFLTLRWPLQVPTLEQSSFGINLLSSRVSESKMRRDLSRSLVSPTMFLSTIWLLFTISTWFAATVTVQLDSMISTLRLSLGSRICTSPPLRVLVSLRQSQKLQLTLCNLMTTNNMMIMRSHSSALISLWQMRVLWSVCSSQVCLKK